MTSDEECNVIVWIRLFDTQSRIQYDHNINYTQISLEHIYLLGRYSCGHHLNCGFKMCHEIWRHIIVKLVIYW